MEVPAVSYEDLSGISEEATGSKDIEMKDRISLSTYYDPAFRPRKVETFKSRNGLPQSYHK